MRGRARLPPRRWRGRHPAPADDLIALSHSHSLSSRSTRFCSMSCAGKRLSSHGSSRAPGRSASERACPARDRPSLERRHARAGRDRRAAGAGAVEELAARDPSCARDVREHRRRTRPVDLSSFTARGGLRGRPRARLATSLLRDRPSPLGRPPARSRQGGRRRVAFAQARHARRSGMGRNAPPPTPVRAVAATVRVRVGPGARGRASPRADGWARATTASEATTSHSRPTS